MATRIAVATAVPKYLQIQDQAGLAVVGKDFDKLIARKLFDQSKIFSDYQKCLDTKKLTEEAIDACHMTGINPQDLYEKQVDFFRQQSESADIATMRHMHYEKRRKNKLGIIFNFL
jgi:hypothetical protein